MLIDFDSEDSSEARVRSRLTGVAVSIVMAAVVTLALIYLQQSLINTGRKGATSAESLRIVDIVRVREQLQLEVKQRKAKPPPRPDEMPEPVPTPDFDLSANTGTEWSIHSVTAQMPGISPAGGFSLLDGEYLPLVKVEPVYPVRALQQGLAGWVVVEFTVTEIGSTRNPVVISNCAIHQRGAVVPQCSDRPNSIFDKAALIAASKFKYKPKVISGEAISTGGVRNRISFVLDG